MHTGKRKEVNGWALETGQKYDSWRTVKRGMVYDIVQFIHIYTISMQFTFFTSHYAFMATRRNGNSAVV